MSDYREELRLNGSLRTSVRANCDKVLMGAREHDIRARAGERGLAVEVQVACLLNQATDPNLLGRVWTGWDPWV